MNDQAVHVEGEWTKGNACILRRGHCHRLRGGVAPFGRVAGRLERGLDAGLRFLGGRLLRTFGFQSFQFGACRLGAFELGRVLEALDKAAQDFVSSVGQIAAHPRHQALRGRR